MVSKLRAQRMVEKLLRWCAKQVPYEVRTRREWIIVRSTFNRRLEGEIPRDILEALGLDVSAIDTGGTVFIPCEISSLMRQQPEWQDPPLKKLLAESVKQHLYHQQDAPSDEGEQS